MSVFSDTASQLVASLESELNELLDRFLEGRGAGDCPDYIEASTIYPTGGRLVLRFEFPSGEEGA